MPSSRRLSISSQERRRADGSNPVVGSSRKSRSGSPTSPRARSSRRCWPPESVLTRAPALLAQADQVDHLPGGPRVRVVAAEQLQHLAHGQLAEVAGGLEHDADPLAEVPPAPLRVEAEHLDLAGVAVPVALEDLHGGRLAGPVRSQQREALALGDLEVDAADGFQLAVAACADRSPGWPPSPPPPSSGVEPQGSLKPCEPGTGAGGRAGGRGGGGGRLRRRRRRRRRGAGRRALVPAPGRRAQARDRRPPGRGGPDPAGGVVLHAGARGAARAALPRPAAAPGDQLRAPVHPRTRPATCSWSARSRCGRSPPRRSTGWSARSWISPMPPICPRWRLGSHRALPPKKPGGPAWPRVPPVHRKFHRSNSTRL